MFAPRALARQVSRFAPWARACAVGTACALLTGCSLSALDALGRKPDPAAPVVDSGPKRAWSGLQSADAQPVWPAVSVPASITAVAQERLAALTLGMSADAVAAQLGAPHGMLRDPSGEEVRQYVIVDGAGNRAYIASFWFGPKGLWLASGRSRPIGQLASVNLGTPLAATAPAPNTSAAAVAPPAAATGASAATAGAPTPAAAATVPAAAPPAAKPAAAPVAIAAAPPTASAQAAPPSASAQPSAPMASAQVAPPTASASSTPPAASASPAPRSPPPAPAAAPTVNNATPATAASTATDVIEEAALREALAGWLEDWSKQNVTGYLARYTSDFVSPGKPRDEWEKERRTRLMRPKFIRVKAEQVKVRWPGSVRPQLEFVQRYESNVLKDTTLKVLTFVKRDGRWLIEQEDSAPLPLSR